MAFSAAKMAASTDSGSKKGIFKSFLSFLALPWFETTI